MLYHKPAETFARSDGRERGGNFPTTQRPGRNQELNPRAHVNELAPRGDRVAGLR